MKNTTTPTTPKRNDLAEAARAARPSRVVKKTTSDAVDHYVIKHLVVIRESAKKAARGVVGMTEFALMGQQTLERADVRNLPGSQILKPILDELIANTPEGRALRESLNGITVVDADNPKIIIGYFFKFGDTGYLLCVVSATKPVVKVENNLVDMSNAFTVALARLINRYRVKELHAGRFDRLVRSTLVVIDLQTALISNGTLVHCSGFTFDMSDKGDQAMFNFQATMAEASVKSAVGGMTNGWHRRALNGMWPFAESAIPGAGYRLVSDTDPTLIPDLNQQEMIKDLITWAADENLSLMDIAKKLSKNYKWGSPNVKQRSKDDKFIILDSRYPETAVLNLLRNGLPMWLEGVYPLTARITHLMGKKDLLQEVQELLQEVDENGNEYTQPIVTFNLPLNHQNLPGGQWADKKLIEAAIRLRLVEKKPTAKGRGSSKAELKPLSGVSEWVEGNTQYRLSSRHHDFYTLLARPVKFAVDKNGNRFGWSESDEKDVRATIRPAELHKALSNAIAKQIGKTTYTRIVSGSRGVDTEVQEDLGRIQELEKELAIAHRQEKAARFDYEAARDLAIDEPSLANKNAVSEFLSNRNAAQAKAESLAKRIGAAKSLNETGRRVAPGAHVSLDNLLAVIVELETTLDKAPRALNDSILQLLVNTTFKLSDDKLKVEFTTNVHLNTSDGPIIAGPITGTVPNRKRVARAARKDAMFEKIFKDGLSFEEAAFECGYTNPVEAKRFLRDWLVSANVIPTKGLRSAAIDCPIKEAKLVIYEMHQAKFEKRKFKAPAKVDPLYAEHIRATYSDTKTQWCGNWHSGNPTPSRRAVAQVLAAGRNGAQWDEILISLELDDRASRYIEIECILGKEAAGGTRPVLERTVERWDRWTKPEDRTVKARQCPHCKGRTLTHIVRVPEVEGGVICTKCRRTEKNGLFQYPAEYLQPWVGPREVGTGKRGAVANTGTVIEHPCSKDKKEGR